MILLAACNPSRRTQDGTPAQFGSQEQTGGDKVVSTYERTARYGVCPVYKISIRTDRTVKCEGTSFVKVKGPAEWQLSPDAMASLRGAFERAKFSSFRA